jgi:hypothetical protein
MACETNRPVRVLPLLVATALLSACAAQHDGAGGEDAEISAEPVSVQEPLAAAPPECEADIGCILSVYTSPVSAVGDCYCPACPVPLATAVAAAHEHGWRVHCAEWPEGRECMVPMCAPPPGEVGCADGRCGWRIDEGAREP